MDINQPTLIQFENIRNQNNIIPPLKSNSFYNVGDGQINIFCITNDPIKYCFDLIIYKNNVYTGIGNFYICSDDVDVKSPYRSLNILSGTTLSVTQGLTIYGGKMNVEGSLELMQHSRMYIRNKSNVIFQSNSVLTINKSSDIIIEQGATLVIYGTININVAQLDAVINNKNIIIDSAAILNVTGINYTNKQFSLTQYKDELEARDVNVNTQGEKNYDNGLSRIGYKWTDGKPLDHSYVIDVFTLLGEIVLGDLRCSITGFPEHVYQNSKTISNLSIKKDTTLYISEEYRDSTYMRPELYLGVLIGNNRIPANCTVYGSIICDGINSMISVDRGATLYIEEGGEVHLRNGAVMRSTYNENKIVLYIDGTLVIEDIAQIRTFESSNIKFGPKGKVIILNPDTGKKRLLFTTPNGILKSDLYRIFIDKIDHIEYHVSNNTGIGIDQYYDFYARDMVNWFGNRRFEKAIKDGILVWDDGGYIELYSNIIPWVNNKCTLLHASRIFKTYGSYDKEKLQDAANRLTYAGCGNILFRFINGDNIKEITLILKSIHMKNIFNNPSLGKYVLHADNIGLLFLRNNVPNTSISELINPKAKITEVINDEADFTL